MLINLRHSICYKLQRIINIMEFSNCHTERSEALPFFNQVRFFVLLRMTRKYFLLNVGVSGWVWYTPVRRRSLLLI